MERWFFRSLAMMLTCTRLAVATYLLYAIITTLFWGIDYSVCIFFVLVCIALMSDYLDGKVARARNGIGITKLGTLLDPLADKALVGTVLIQLAFVSTPRRLISHDLIHSAQYLSIILIAIDVSVLLLAIYVAIKGVDIAANGLGKLKMNTQAITVFIWFASCCFDEFFLARTLEWSMSIVIFGLAVSLIFAIASAISYLPRLYRT